MLFLPQTLKRSSVDELKVQGGKYWLKSGLDFSSNFHPTVLRTTLFKMLLIVHNCWFFGNCSVNFGCCTVGKVEEWEKCKLRSSCCELPIGGLHDLLLDRILDRHHCHHCDEEEEHNLQNIALHV